MPQPFADQFRSIPMSSDLGESLERAHDFAREQGHRAVTLEHLLLAFTEDVDASAVLQASNVDLERLGTDVSGYLGRLLEDMRAENGVDPSTDPELLRVLHAAVQAAQQSRRREIDGAIVLAAVVGDGKSPAAGLLKAHGLTFEEAIRALQKANAKANAQARSKQFATPASPPAPTTPPAPASVENGSVVLAPQSGISNAGAPAVGQSVDDILASARARIQQRAAAIVGRPPEAAQAPPLVADATPPQPPKIENTPAPAPEPLEESGDLADDVAPPPVTPSAAPPPPPPAPARPVQRSRSDWAPPAAPAPAVAAGMPSPRLPQPPPQRPLPQRQSQPGDGSPRPPLPHRATLNPGLPPPASAPNRQARAPWPDGHEPGPPLRPPPAANGALAETPSLPAARRPGQRTGGQGGQGPLVETIPRRMKVGVPTSAQVRIGRDRVDSLVLLLMKGRGMAHRPEALITRTLSVRLRAPDGGFVIEANSPETQWIETASGLHQDEFVTWRWTVTPQRRGRRRLVLVVAARTVGHDGLAAETAPPDRTIEVVVTGGRLRRLAGWGGFIAALVVGAVLGRFGSEFWALGTAILKRFI